MTSISPCERCPEPCRSIVTNAGDALLTYLPIMEQQANALVDIAANMPEAISDAVLTGELSTSEQLEEADAKKERVITDTAAHYTVFQEASTLIGSILERLATTDCAAQPELECPRQNVLAAHAGAFNQIIARSNAIIAGRQEP